jgi:DNA modification methylase
VPPADPTPDSTRDSVPDSVPDVAPRETFQHGPVALHHVDAFDWLTTRAPDSIHAVVTDPPYGVVEYSSEQQEKLRSGTGGVWRQPPTLNGVKRAPLPRFTTLTPAELLALEAFFRTLADHLHRVLTPGGHVLLAANPLVSHLIGYQFSAAGLERRGEVVRLVQTMRGGDRPKGHHLRYADVSVMPRSQWEPWLLYRKPLAGTAATTLDTYGTGALRRISDAQPFGDVIASAPTHKRERALAPHPSLKPQAFLRQVVRASLPLGTGIVLDPFAGSGSTLAAACALGYQAIGLERDPEYFTLASAAIPKLAAYQPTKR